MGLVTRPRAAGRTLRGRLAALRLAAARLTAVLAAGTLAACTHLGTVEGAIPLAPGTHDFTGELQISRAPNALSTPTGLPLPTARFHVRAGLAPDLDVGLHVYPLGLGGDLRWRFLERDGWHFAVAPGLAGTALPLPALRFGHLDLSLPVRVERPIGRGWSVAGGPGVLARQTFVGLDTEALSTDAASFELYAGGGLRLQRLGKHLKVGVSVDVYVDTTRATGLYGGLGFDLGTVARPRARSRSVGIEAPSPEDSE